MHLKVLQLRYCGRDSIIQVRIDLIFIMVPLGEHDPTFKVKSHFLFQAVVIHDLTVSFKLGRIKGTYEIWKITNFVLN